MQVKRGWQRLTHRVRTLGLRRTAGYVLFTVLLERIGVRINCVFAPAAERTGQAPAGCQVIAAGAMDSLSAADIQSLEQYGGKPLLDEFARGFGRGEKCLVARIGGALAGVCWLTQAQSYRPAGGRGCVMIERCFTLPEYRGRGVFPATLAHALSWLRENGRPGEAPFIECSAFNSSSEAGIRKAGFRKTGLLVEAWRWKYFKPAP